MLSAINISDRLKNAAPQATAFWLRTPQTLPPGLQWLRMPDDAAACAHELFARLRELDAAGVDEIWIEAPPLDAIWDGVRDRLLRASA